jgi:2-dehydropantoate 2-reductase
MGSVYAGLMQLAGHEVHGICLWTDHVRAVQTGGLRVHGKSGDHTVDLASMGTSTDGVGECDLVVIATKAFDVESAAQAARPLIGPGTVVQSIQNGLGSPERVAGVLGGERLAIGVVGGFGASVSTPGEVHHNGMEMVRFGAYDTLTRADLEASAQVWTSAGFEVRLFDDTDQMVWEKLIMNVAFSGTTCLTGMTIGQVLADADAWHVAQECALEAVAVARAAGIFLDVGDPIQHVRLLGGRIPDARPSMLLDHLLGERGEVDAILVQVARLGERHGVATPTQQTVADLIRARESLMAAAPERQRGDSPREPSSSARLNA